MNKARKKFILWAMAAILVLLTVLLGIINGVNYTMAAEDADQITLRLARERGAFETRQTEEEGRGALFMRGGRPAQMGPMGPDSPEMAFSLRYFTFAFDESGEGEKVAMQIMAVSEEDALAWAKSLLGEQETGWTGSTYRYRVYGAEGKTYVTVIDQGRELLGAYRILMISLIGLALGMAVSGGTLWYIGRRLFGPLEEADRKQKRFIAQAEKELKVPLTVMSANTEIIERETGESEQTRSLHRQVRRMNALCKSLATLGVYEEKGVRYTECDLREMLLAAADVARSQYPDREAILSVESEGAVKVMGDGDMLSDMLVEIADNAVKFGRVRAKIRLTERAGRVTVISENDTSLPDGTYDQAFDRFTRLDNAKDLPGAGLGLSHVKEIVKAHNGRASASAQNGTFTLTVSL